MHELEYEAQIIYILQSGTPKVSYFGPSCSINCTYFQSQFSITPFLILFSFKNINVGDYFWNTLFSTILLVILIIGKKSYLLGSAIFEITKWNGITEEPKTSGSMWSQMWHFWCYRLYLRRHVNLVMELLNT